MVYDLIFTFLMMILDGLISIIFTNDYALLTPIFVPALTTCAFMLNARDLNYREALEYSVVTGLLMGIFEPSDIWTYVICYLLILIVIKTWSLSISDSFLEQMILCLLAIFLKELIIYAIESFYQNTNLSIMMWIYKVLFKTIVFNVPLSIAVIFLNKKKVEIVRDFANNKKKKEKVFWGD